MVTEKEKKTVKIWSRMIALVDMNAFFASIEQLDKPQLKGKPVAVTNGLQGTCIITCSYEARRQGVHTGMRVQSARKICPELIQCAARPQRYAEVSRTIMDVLKTLTPDIEVFSVDEAFLDLTHCQMVWGSAKSVGQRIKKLIDDVIGLPCSIGISGDKTTAKFAAKQHKPNGLTIVKPEQAREYLKPVPVMELCGIGPGIGRFLQERGVTVCGDMEKLPMSTLTQRFGSPGRRIWHMCQGLDPEKMNTEVAAPSSMGHGKVMPPNTRDQESIKTYLMHMSEKLAYRLRRNAMEASKFYIGLKIDKEWLYEHYATALPINNGRAIARLCNKFFAQNWYGQGVYGVQVSALDPRPAKQQFELFLENEQDNQDLNRVMDRINERYGEFTLAPAKLLQRSNMPNVIAPAWKPFGHRQTINGC